MPARQRETAAKGAEETLCLVHGDDDYGVKERAREVFRRWTEETGSEDREIIDAQVSHSGEALRSIGRLREAMQTLPFFGGTKIIWWQNCSFLGDDRTGGAQAVTEALGEIAQEIKAFDWRSVRLLISAGKVDKRKVFYKAIDKTGAVEAVAAWTIDDRDWQERAEELAAREIRGRGREIGAEALALLTSSVGPNRHQLLNEIEKLCLYAGEEIRLTAGQVEAIVTQQKQARAFALADALGERDLPRLLRRLDEELWEIRLDRQRSVIGLLYGLISKVRMMLLLKELEREKRIRPVPSFAAFKSQLERIPADVLPSDRRYNPLSMNPYPLFRAMGHSVNYTTSELVEAMELLLRCNQDLIFSTLEGGMILQQTLVQIVRGNAPPPANGYC